jgi:hypothetical protein
LSIHSFRETRREEEKSFCRNEASWCEAEQGSGIVSFTI